jgi:hypothetical protein
MAYQDFTGWRVRRDLPAGRLIWDKRPNLKKQQAKKIAILEIILALRPTLLSAGRRYILHLFAELCRSTHPGIIRIHLCSF